MLYQVGLFSETFIHAINSKTPQEWDYAFSDEVYKEVKKNAIYITNLSKATQIDARGLPNAVFREYIDILKKEITIVKPKVIIAFGNQVSAVLLNKNISVSNYRKKYVSLNIEGSSYKVFPVYYPVGQGMRNIHIAKEDIAWIIKNHVHSI